MPPHAFATPPERPSRGDDREQKVAALRLRVQAEADALRTADDWARCIQVAARLPGESFANVLLISAQRPDATLVKSYGAWQAMGRQVGRQEKGIEIFSSVRRQPGGKRRVHRRDAEPGKAGPQLA